MGTGAPDTGDSGPEVGETTANGAEDAGRDGGGGGGDTREAAAVSEAAEIKFAQEAEVTPALEEVELDTGSSADNSTTEDTEGYCHDDSVLDSIKNADRGIEHDRDPELVEDDLPAPSIPPEPIARSQSRISNASSKGSKTDAAAAGLSYGMLGCRTGAWILMGISRQIQSSYLSNARIILCKTFVIVVFTWVLIVGHIHSC